MEGIRLSGQHVYIRRGIIDITAKINKKEDIDAVLNLLPLTRDEEVEIRIELLKEPQCHRCWDKDLLVKVVYGDEERYFCRSCFSWKYWIDKTPKKREEIFQRLENVKLYLLKNEVKCQHCYDDEERYKKEHDYDYVYNKGYAYGVTIYRDFSGSILCKNCIEKVGLREGFPKIIIFENNP